MKVLVLGSGGREHAIVWKLAQSSSVEKIVAVPGNAGIAELAECHPGDPGDAAAMIAFAREQKVDLTVVGPEAPLVAGIVDRFLDEGLRIFGPSAAAARLEGSKSFAKEFMARHSIPTGGFAVFEDYQQALGYVEQRAMPLVVKADGLAAGKGVTVARTMEEAVEAVRRCMIAKDFGPGGERVVIEEALTGPEISVLAFTDGRTALAMDAAQDYKPAFDDNRGPNTGGMGAYSPVPAVADGVFAEIVEQVIQRTMEALSGEGIDYRGVLYAGLMLTEQGPRVLEYNVRFGDPETQVILPRLAGDLAELMMAVVERNLADYRLTWRPERAVTVVMASRGYPRSYSTDYPIQGLEEAGRIPDVSVFHAGTIERGGEIITAGGRVLAVTGLGDSFARAREAAYRGVGAIDFEGAHYRSDIGGEPERSELAQTTSS